MHHLPFHSGSLLPCSTVSEIKINPTLSVDLYHVSRPLIFLSNLLSRSQSAVHFHIVTGLGSQRDSHFLILCKAKHHSSTIPEAPTALVASFWVLQGISNGEFDPKQLYCCKRTFGHVRLHMRWTAHCYHKTMPQTRTTCSIVWDHEIKKNVPHFCKIWTNFDHQQSTDL